MEERERKRQKELRRQEKRRKAEELKGGSKKKSPKDPSLRAGPSAEDGKDDENVDSDSSVNSFVPEQETTCCLVCYEDMTMILSSLRAAFIVSLNLGLHQHPHPACNMRFVSWCSCRGPRQQTRLEKRRASCVVPDCDAFYSEVFLKRAVAPAVMDKRGELERNWTWRKWSDLERSAWK